MPTRFVAAERAFLSVERRLVPLQRTVEARLVPTGTPTTIPEGAFVTLPPHEGKPSESQVWEALRSVHDPEIPVNIVDLGLIYGCRIDDTGVSIDMTLTAPGCGMGPVLVQDVERRVGLVPFVDEVNVELVFDPPWSRDRMTDEAQLELGLF